MELEGIMLSEISWEEKGKINIYIYDLLYMWNLSRLVVARGREQNMCGSGQTSSSKRNKFWGSNVKHGDYS